MTRYFTRPRQGSPANREMVDWPGFPLVPDISASDHLPKDTGLLDHKGNPIMRAPNPMGFGRDGEW